MGGVRWSVAVLMMLGAVAPAAGQTLVFSGAGAKASPGGGTRSALFMAGKYFVFFDDGTGVGVVYASSVDGASFSAPAPASGAPATLGFSVARKDASTLGLVWAHSDATGYEIWYREATVGATLTFAPAMRVTASPTDERGFLATLAYSAGGRPYIAAVANNLAYTGPIGGCGPGGRYRPSHYFFDGATWQARGYCNNFQAALEPSAIALAPSGTNMIVSMILQGSLSTAIVNDSVELGEPWNAAPAVGTAQSRQLSAAQSLTMPTDVHYLYQDSAGGIRYARQDGTLVAAGDNMLDVTMVSTAASAPALARPAAAAGCYTIAYVAGNSIRARRFTGAIATLTPEVTLFSTSGSASNLSAELDASGSPALVWQVGSAIYFGWPGPLPRER